MNIFKLTLYKVNQQKSKPITELSNLSREFSCGMFDTKEKALKCVIENYCDLFERGYYNLASIENVPTGLYSTSIETLWLRSTATQNKNTFRIHYSIELATSPVLSNEYDPSFSCELEEKFQNWIFIHNHMSRIYSEIKNIGDISLGCETKIVYDNYCGEDRFYHNLNHIADCIKKLNYFNLPKSCYDIAVLSFIYHDVDYGNKDSEYISSNIFKKSVWFLNDEFKVVPDIINMTKDHNPTNELERIVSDIDMSILSSDKDKFKEYCDNIEKEYLFIGVNKYTFNMGRKLFLRKMKKFSFSTKIGRTLWQVNLSNNLNNMS
jgi:predicted metal-dependent HD superfamily phosphohydrolase